MIMVWAAMPPEQSGRNGRTVARRGVVWCGGAAARRRGGTP